MRRTVTAALAIYVAELGHELDRNDNDDDDDDERFVHRRVAQSDILNTEAQMTVHGLTIG